MVQYQSHIVTHRYAFGDLTTEAMKRAGVVDDDYEFGDISKSAANSVGRALTGDDDYKFGVITRKLWKKVSGSSE